MSHRAGLSLSNIVYPTLSLRKGLIESKVAYGLAAASLINPDEESLTGLQNPAARDRCRVYVLSEG